MKKLLTLAAMLALLLTPAFAQAQSLPHFEKFLGADFSGIYQSAISTDVAMVVKLTAPEHYGTLEVTAADGDLVFTLDGAADTSIICPSGGTGGTIDVSNGDCNTFGEVIDIINGDSDGYWKAALVGALRTDASTSTNGILITAAPADASAGLSLLFDGTETDTVSQLISTKRLPADYIQAGQLVQNPYSGTVQLLDYLTFTTTHDGGGNNNLTISCVERRYSGVSATENVTSMLGAVAGAATTVATVYDAADWGSFGLHGCKDQAIHIRIAVGANNITAAVVSAHAIEYASR